MQVLLQEEVAAVEVLVCLQKQLLARRPAQLALKVQSLAEAGVPKPAESLRVPNLAKSLHPRVPKLANKYEKDIGHLDGRVERLRKSVLDEMTALEQHWDKVAEAISACKNGDDDNHEPFAAFLKAIKAAQTLCRDGAAKVKIQQAKLERSKSSQNVFKDTADCLSKLAKQFIDVSLLCKSVSDPSSDSVELNATIASVDKHFADSQLDPQPSLSHTFRHIAVSRQALFITVIVHFCVRSLCSAILLFSCC